MWRKKLWNTRKSKERCRRINKTFIFIFLTFVSDLVLQSSKTLICEIILKNLINIIGNCLNRNYVP